MTKFNLVALGGTFDLIHKGHKELLNQAFSISSQVIIGLTSDELASSKGKKTLNNYLKRLENLNSYLKNNFPHTNHKISKLENDFGPAVLEEGVQALVVSQETSNQGKVLNNLRSAKNLPPVEVIVVPMVKAEDGIRISTTRIRNSEIDMDGKLR